MADAQNLIPARPSDPKTFFTVQEPPVKELQPDCYVLLMVDLVDSEANVLTYCWSQDDATKLLESYALNSMAMRAARDCSFPQPDTEAARDRHRPSLQNPHGAGVCALSRYEPPWDDVVEGDYVVFFEPEHIRIINDRKDDERIYLARRPHPRDENYNNLSFQEKQTGIKLAYFSMFTARMNINDLLRAKTELSEYALNNETVLVDRTSDDDDDDDDDDESSEDEEISSLDILQ